MAINIVCSGVTIHKKVKKILNFNMYKFNQTGVLMLSWIITLGVVLFILKFFYILKVIGV